MKKKSLDYLMVNDEVQFFIQATLAQIPCYAFST